MFFYVWIDLIFPPICRFCKETTRAPIFCLPCWEECAIVEKVGRCKHCFDEVEGSCERCKEKRSLPYPTAFVFESTEPAHHLVHFLEDDPEMLASFVLVQWGKTWLADSRLHRGFK